MNKTKVEETMSHLTDIIADNMIILAELDLDPNTRKMVENQIAQSQSDRIDIEKIIKGEIK